jgi:uncharacterized protein
MINTKKKGASRRDFLKTAVFGSMFGTLGLSTKAVTRPQPFGKKESGTWLPFIEKICPVIDCHLHAPSESDGHSGQWKGIHETTQEFVDFLNMCGVDYGIVNSNHYRDGHPAREFIQANYEALALAKKYPDRFIPACMVNGNHPDESVKELIKYRTEHGIFWTGELVSYVHKYDYGTEKFERILDTIAEYEMVCHIHARVADLEPLVKKYRNITFILPHFTPQKERIFSRIEFVKQNPNVYLDICGISFCRIGILEHAVEEIGEDRVLFGSDFEINDPAAVIARVLNAKLPLDAKKKIFYGNAKQLIEKFDYEKKFINFLD